MKVKFKKVLFVKFIDDGVDDPWLDAKENINDLAEVEGPVLIAKYELKEIKKISLRIHEEK